MAKLRIQTDVPRAHLDALKRYCEAQGMSKAEYFRAHLREMHGCNWQTIRIEREKL